MQDLLSTQDVATHYNVQPITVRKWCLRKLFPNAQKIGRDWVIPKSDLKDFKLPTPGYPKGRPRHPASSDDGGGEDEDISREMPRD